MSADKIEITYVEFDNDTQPSNPSRSIGELYYAEWRRNGGEIDSAFARPHKASRNEGEDHLISDDVRVALALLVAPGLVEAVTKAPGPPVKPAPDTRGQDTVSDSRSIREGKPR